MFNQHDQNYMALALTLARKGLYTTRPNPRVGCVIVKNNVIIGQGWHVKKGAAHAETLALKDAQQAHEQEIRGATVYVTLEPCCHTGSTPPCCDALIDSQVAKVVIAMRDPNAEVAGKGIQKLEQCGVEVVEGLCELEAKQLNPGFIKRMLQHHPFVRSKIAVSLDGRTALANGQSKWITSSQSRLDVQKLRARSCAILSTINTVIQDNPFLTVRDLGVDEAGAAMKISAQIEQPKRIILDSQLRIAGTENVLNDGHETHILTASKDREKIAMLQGKGIIVKDIVLDGARLCLDAVFAYLADLQLNEVLIEAGPTLNGVLLEKKLIDELVIYIAPVFMGNQARAMFNISGVADMKQAPRFHIKETRKIGNDMRITGIFSEAQV